MRLSSLFVALATLGLVFGCSQQDEADPAAAGAGAQGESPPPVIDERSAEQVIADLDSSMACQEFLVVGDADKPLLVASAFAEAGGDMIWQVVGTDGVDKLTAAVVAACEDDPGASLTDVAADIELSSENQF